MQQSPAHAIDKVKLPKLSFMTFNGDPTQWTSVWESLESTISQIQTLRILTSSNIYNAH